MLLLKIKDNILGCMVAISAVFSFVVLNRWVVTDLKLKSFGKVWPYFISWFDFGFGRRMLIGTVLTETGLNNVVSNEYLFAYLFYGFLMTISYFIIYRIIETDQKLLNNNVLSFIVLLSPATFSHFTYTTGNNDLELFILFTTSIFIVRNTLMLSLVLVVGVLVHQLFVFFLPGIFVLKYITRQDLSRSDAFNGIRGLIIPFITALSTIVVVTTLGKLDIDESTYNELMASRIPAAAHQLELWSGYFEIGSNIENHVRSLSEVVKNLWDMKYYIFIPTSYALLIAWICAWNLRAGMLEKISIFIAILCPFLIIFVGTDYYRWTSVSACIGLVALMALIAKDKIVIPKWGLIFLIFYSLFAPFGSADLSRPFPLHQFILEKLLQ